MNYKKRMLRTTAIYFAGQMSTRFLSILLLPLYTKYIDTAAYGYFDIVQTYLNVAVPFFFFEVWSAVLRFTLEKEEQEEKSTIITNSFFVSFIGFFLFTLAFWIVTGVITLEHSGLIYAYAISWMLQLMMMGVCRGLLDNFSYAISGAIGVIVVSGISLLGIFYFKWGIETLFISNIVSYLLQSLFLAFRVRINRYIIPKYFNKNILKDLFRFCIPLSINTIFYWLLSSINRVIIVQYLGYSANGIYSVANKLGNIITAFVAIFMLSWQEIVFCLKYDETNEIQQIYDAEFRNIKVLLGLAVLCLLPITNFFFNIIIGEGYFEAFNLIPLLYFMVFLTSVNSFIEVVFSAVHETKKMLYVKVVGGITNVAIIFLLIHTVGLFASPIAMICSQGVSMFLNCYLLREHVRIKLGFQYLMVFCTVYILGAWIYYTQSRMVNILWLLIIGAFAVYYMKDMIKQIIIAISARFQSR